MKIKNFLVGGVVGGIVDYLMGWLLYGNLLAKFFPREVEPDMTFILFGCLTYGFFISYIMTAISKTTSSLQGFKIGAALGLLVGLYSNFFKLSTTLGANYDLFSLDLVVIIIMSSIVGTVVAAVNDKMS